MPHDSRRSFLFSSLFSSHFIPQLWFFLSIFLVNPIGRSFYSRQVYRNVFFLIKDKNWSVPASSKCVCACEFGSTAITEVFFPPITTIKSEYSKCCNITQWVLLQYFTSNGTFLRTTIASRYICIKKIIRKKIVSVAASSKCI